MSITRLFLTLLFFPAFVLLVRGFGSRARALRVVTMALGLMAAGTIITNPQLLDAIATSAGINSSVELVLYLVVLALVTIIAYMVAKFRHLEKRVAKLVQALATTEAISDESRK